MYPTYVLVKITIHKWVFFIFVHWCVSECVFIVEIDIISFWPLSGLQQDVHYLFVWHHIGVLYYGRIMWHRDIYVTGPWTYVRRSFPAYGSYIFVEHFQFFFFRLWVVYLPVSWISRRTFCTVGLPANYALLYKSESSVVPFRLILTYCTFVLCYSSHLLLHHVCLERDVWKPPS